MALELRSPIAAIGWAAVITAWCTRIDPWIEGATGAGMSVLMEYHDTSASSLVNARVSIAMRVC